MGNKYIKIEELEKLTNIDITSLKELGKDKTYLITIEVRDTPKDIVANIVNTLGDVLHNEGIKSIIIPVDNGLPELKIYELQESLTINLSENILQMSEDIK